MNKLIEVADLQVGDEIIVPVNSSFRYLRVLRQIKHRKGGKTHWKTNKPLYSAVYCSTKKDTVVTQRGSGSYKWDSKIHTYTITDKDHNFEGYVDLNHKSIWLVKR